MNDRAKESEAEDALDSQGEMTFVEHLVELRNRLLRVVIVVAILLLCLMPFANRLYAVLAAPLLAEMQMGSSMIATQVASPFLTPFKLALVAAILIGMPYILYQFWAFVAPGLYRHEKRLVFPLMVSSSLLFYLGMAFAYYVVFPLMFAFFQAVAPEGVEIMTDISSYLDFVLKIFFAFGLGVRSSDRDRGARMDRVHDPRIAGAEAALHHRRRIRGRHAVDAPGHDFTDAAGVAGVGAVRARSDLLQGLRSARCGRGRERRERELIRRVHSAPSAIPASAPRGHSRVRFRRHFRHQGVQSGGFGEHIPAWRELLFGRHKS